MIHNIQRCLIPKVTEKIQISQNFKWEKSNNLAFMYVIHLFLVLKIVFSNIPSSSQINFSYSALSIL